MGKFIDLTGKKFGRLIVIKRVKNNYFGVVYWLCKCDCGNFKTIRGNNLKSGKTQSCGCLQKEKAKNIGENKRKYKKEYLSLRCIFKGIKNRCYNKKSNNYNRYGAKGISICKKWLDNPLSFCEWALQNGYKKGLTIDRIDTNGKYEPNNCRWVDYTTQCRNRKNSLTFTINDICLPLIEWCKIYNMPYQAVLKRLKRKWQIEKALTIPLKNKVQLFS